MKESGPSNETYADKDAVVAALLEDPENGEAIRSYLETRETGPHDPVTVGFDLADIYMAAKLPHLARETLEALLEQAANEDDRESWDEIAAKFEALGL